MSGHKNMSGHISTANQSPEEPASVTGSVIGSVIASGGRFAVTIAEPYRPALEGLADFSHLIVTWWADRADELAGHGPLIAEPTPYVEGPTRAGVFATRSPLRPTPIGLSVAGIISVDDTTGEIELGWIDALDNTPVVDIKPYFPSSDRVRNATVPSWCTTWPHCLEDSASFDWAAVLREG